MKMKDTILVCLVAVSLAGCKVEDEFDGPSLNDLYGEFAILQGLGISNDNVDFSAGQSTYFTAEFSKNVEWKLEVTGLVSGAKKTLSGFSNKLGSTNAGWDGGASELPMFKIEDCAVELTFSAEQDTLRDTLSVLGNKIYTGFLISDFESGLNPGWNSFVQSGANMSFTIQNSPTSAQGNNAFDIGGTVNWDWLIGLINMPGSAYGNTTYPLSENPNNEYFNVMLYKDPALSNGIMLFQFREDDNGDGVYSDNAEDLFSMEVQLTENGWKLYSSKYADLPTLINGAPANPIGNGIYEPHKLIQVSMLFLANPSSGYAHSKLDYLIFTQGGPLSL
jgi:hypothetical protein